MNYSLAIFLISDRVRAVATAYQNEKKDTGYDEDRHYTYKTFDPNIKVDDLVIVPTGTRHGMTIVKVVAVDVEPDYDSSIDYKWILGVVDTVDADDYMKQEAEAIAAIKSGEKRQRRAALRTTLKESVGGDMTLLLLYTENEDEYEDAEPPTTAIGVDDDEEIPF